MSEFIEYITRNMLNINLTYDIMISIGYAVTHIMNMRNTNSRVLIFNLYDTAKHTTSKYPEIKELGIVNAENIESLINDSLMYSKIIGHNAIDNSQYDSKTIANIINYLISYEFKYVIGKSFFFKLT